MAKTRQGCVLGFKIFANLAAAQAYQGGEFGLFSYFYNLSKKQTEMSRLSLVVIFVYALIFSVLVNEWNLSAALAELGEGGTRYTYTLKSPDNNWYTPQIKHYLAGQGFTLDPKYPELAVRRSPGYPLFYGLHYILFGEEKSFYYIRYTQSLLFALSAMLLASALWYLSKRRDMALFSGLLYGSLPFTLVYNYHVLTEPLALVFLVFSIYAYARHRSSGGLFWLGLAALALGLGTLTRPLLGAFLPGLGLAALGSWSGLRTWVWWQRALRLGLLVGLSFALPFLPWIWRNYQLRGEFIWAEKYYDDPMDYGLAHMALRDFYSGFHNSGSGRIELISNAFNQGDSLAAAQQIALLKAELSLASVAQEVRLDSLLWAYGVCCQESQAFRREHPEVERSALYKLPCQLSAEKAFRRLTEEDKGANPIRYYVITPVKTLFKMVVQSHSNNFTALTPLQGELSFGQKLIKALFLILHLTLYLGFVSSLWLGSPWAELRRVQVWGLLGVLLSLFVLVFVFRHLENRYTLPFFPFLVLGLSQSLGALKDRWGAQIGV